MCHLKPWRGKILITAENLRFSLMCFPLLFQELVVGLHGLVMQFETNFGVVALQFLEEDRQRENAPPAAAITPSGWIVVGSGPSSNVEGVTNAIPGSERKSSRGLRASFSTSHLSNFATNPPVVSGEYFNTVVLL